MTKKEIAELVKENIVLIVFSILLGIMIGQNLHLRKQVAYWKNNVVVWRVEAGTWQKACEVWYGVVQVREKHQNEEGLKEMGIWEPKKK